MVCAADQQCVDVGSQLPLAVEGALCGSTCVCAAGHGAAQVVHSTSAIDGTAGEQCVDKSSQVPLAGVEAMRGSTCSARLVLLRHR